MTKDYEPLHVVTTASRAAAQSLRGVYRRRKYLSGSHEGRPTEFYGVRWADVERRPRHYFPTRVELCPRQRAKRLKTAGG